MSQISVSIKVKPKAPYLHKIVLSESGKRALKALLSICKYRIRFFYIIPLASVTHKRGYMFVPYAVRRRIFIKRTRGFLCINENLYSVHDLHKPSLGFTYIWMLLCQAAAKLFPLFASKSSSFAGNTLRGLKDAQMTSREDATFWSERLWRNTDPQSVGKALQIWKDLEARYFLANYFFLEFCLKTFIHVKVYGEVSECI